MKLVNLDNYPGIQAHGVFSNIQDPKHTESGSTAYVLSNYAGLYAVALGDESSALLLCVTDSHEIAQELQNILARRH